ncbi:molecular chaperone TorD family protein [Sulfurimonas sp.]|uniref:TorD/DmsD family molecular chaperone n=1 Tax=Sulfurimonas sp. TaxID=2022749 RepID=UPI0025D32E32|nr:molecular chaperone TorD family protein [Sulfurimonas sp.]
MNEEKMNKARALYYAMFSRCFVFTTDNSRYFELIEFIDILKENPLDKSSAQAFQNIREVVKSDSNVIFMKEFDAIFHSPETQTLRTTASYYDEDIESGKKRVEMQNFLAKTKIRRNEKSYTEYEDHIGFIFSVMSELCELIANGEEQYKNTAHCIFEQILNDFIDRFSKELYEHENADIFKNVVILLKSFIEFERIYLDVQTPILPEKTAQTKPKGEELSEAEIARRAKNKLLRQQGPKENQDAACPIDISYDVEDDM